MATVEYRCLDCDVAFFVEVTAAELDSGLSADHAEQCPACRQTVGRGLVSCHSCGKRFEVGFPYWHLQCDLSSGYCPRCGARYAEPCIC